MDAVELKQTTKPKRQSNIELLRIITMLMIVAHHLVVHGGFNFGFEVFTVNRLWLRFLELGGKVGVNIFTLISGYFLIKTTTIKMNKVIKLVLQVLAYSVVPYLLLTMFGVYPFTWSELHRMSFPLINGHWWFASAYFLIYILSPILNELLLNLSKQKYKNLLLISIAMWCIVPTIFESLFQSNDLVWLFVVYALGGYIRLWGKSEKSAGHYLGIACILILLTYAQAVLMQYLSMYSSFWYKYYFNIYRVQGIHFLLISLYLFLGFKNLNIGYVKWINVVSATTFGVYLLHENCYVRPFLWHNTLQMASKANDSGFIIFTLIVIFGVFAICSGIEWFRINVIEKLYDKHTNKLSEKLSDKLNKLSSKKIMEKL